MNRAPFRVVVPTRLGSTRLPRKPLRTILGDPMILHVWRRAIASGADEVVVAADDSAICEVIEAAGGTAVLTSAQHESGTDRIAEVAAARAWPSDSIVVNLQGDEPCMNPEHVALVAAALGDRREVGISTLATPIRAPHVLFDPDTVKVVTNAAGHALYFSRAPIPWVRGVLDRGDTLDALPPSVPFLRHVGLYAYRVATLRRFASEPSSEIESAESLEQLRALSCGVSIHVSVVDEVDYRGVDNESDLARAEASMRELFPT